jgi:PleD family two-component response regulator
MDGGRTMAGEKDAAKMLYTVDSLAESVSESCTVVEVSSYTICVTASVGVALTKAFMHDPSSVVAYEL